MNTSTPKTSHFQELIFHPFPTPGCHFRKDADHWMLTMVDQREINGNQGSMSIHWVVTMVDPRQVALPRAVPWPRARRSRGLPAPHACDATRRGASGMSLGLSSKDLGGRQKWWPNISKYAGISWEWWG